MNVYTKWLLIIGGLNWGLVGIGNLMDSNWDVVGLILGGFAGGIVANIVFILVGIAAVVFLFGGKKGGASAGASEMPNSPIN